jgi:galactonate dehydratase
MFTRRQFLLSTLPLWVEARAAEPAALKIRSIEPVVLHIGGRANIVCARIETDEGIYGWGEGTSPPDVQPVIGYLNEFKKLLVGQSAWNIERLWHRLYVESENTLGGTLYTAMSIIDIALYDIVGKKLGVPVYKLLGGRVHDKIRIYTSYRWGNIPRTAEAYAKRTKELIAEGATAGKFDPFVIYPGPDRQLPTPILHEVKEIIRGIREAGPDFDICIEAHGKFNAASAGRFTKMLEPFDPFFLEEPVPPEDVGAMAEVQRSTSIPIATGEGLYSHYGFREVLEKRAARILQPDLSRTGGITATKKIAAMAQTEYVTIAPHNPNGPICSAASIHLAASTPNFLIMEEGGAWREQDVYNAVFTAGWKADSASWRVPEGPGLGIDLSPEFVREHRVKVE